MTVCMTKKIARPLGRPGGVWAYDALLVRLDPPLPYFDSDAADPDSETYGEPNDVAEYVVVSRTTAFGYPEIGTFACDEHGVPDDPMREIRPLSCRGDFTHGEALAFAGYQLIVT